MKKAIMGVLLIMAALINNGCTNTVQSNVYSFDNPSPIIRKLQNQTVMIMCGIALGSGTVIYQDDSYAYIITDRHCVSTLDGKIINNPTIYPMVFIREIAWNNFGYPSEVIASSDTTLDLALIRIDIKKYPKFKSVAILKDNKNLPIGSKMTHCGCPFGIPAFYSEGIISNYFIKNKHLYMYGTTFIQHGSSGGGMYDKDGQFIGICQFIKEDCIGGALTSNDIDIWLKSINYSFLVQNK